MSPRTLTEEQRERKRARDRAYYYRHKARRLEQKLAWSRANPEKRRETTRRWDQRNPEAARQRRLRRARRLKEADGSHTAAQWQVLIEQHASCCAYCQRPFPAEELCKDHIIPLVRGGDNRITNILPSCVQCNSRKGARDVMVFLAELSAERA